MSEPRRARVTLADVARAAGVSTALVSIVMRDAPGASDETRDRVRSIADDMGYVPDQRARTLRQSSSRLIGVTFELREPFHGDLVEEAYRVAEAAGYGLVISAVAPSRGEPTAIDSLVAERCEGLILLGSRLSDAELAEVGRRLPAVVVARSTTAEGVGYVRGDDVAGVGLSVDHLVGLGHRDIVHIDGGSAPGSLDRCTGFRGALDRHGIDDAGRIVGGGLTRSDGAAAMSELLAAGRCPTAVVAFNDDCATGVVDAALHAGISVPRQVSVVGYDDARFAAAAPTPLTTVSQDAVTMASDAVAGMVAMLAGGPPPRVIVEPDLVVRASTCPPNEG